MKNIAFADKCAEVTRVDTKDNGKEKWIKKVYDRSLVTKAIHHIRNPLINVASTFHAEYKIKHGTGNWNYSNNRKGFRKWCRDLDNRYARDEKKLSSVDAYAVLENVLCHGSFLKYIRVRKY